jgi:diacylglycerol kinase (ATP)
MERHKLIESFNCAIEGIVYVLKTQRNMRIHFMAAVIVVVATIFFNISRLDFLFICFAIFFVLLAEMVNTAVELTIDLISETYHPLARLVKDISAGAVLMASVNAVVIGYIVFARELELRLTAGVHTVRHFPVYVTFLTLVAVLLLSVIIKLAFHSGTPMKGGLLSVHSALAFSAVTIVVLLVPSYPLVILLTFFIALLVGQSRVAAGIHRLREVVFGALIGSLFTFLLYQVYRLVAYR